MVERAIKRVTVNLPRQLLQKAEAVADKGTTGTIIEALELLARHRAYVQGMRLKGKLNLDIDLDVSRERGRR